MAIPYESKPLPAVSTFPFDIGAWRGVNKIKGSQADGEMADCKNMCSDNYPYASPRKPRGKIIDEQGIKRIYKVEGNRVYYIDADDYLCYAENGEKTFVTDSEGNKIQMPDVKCTNNYDKCSMFYPTLQYVDENNIVSGPYTRAVFDVIPEEIITDKTGINDKYYFNIYSRIITLENFEAKRFRLKFELPANEDGEYGFPHNIYDHFIGYQLYSFNGELKTSNNEHLYVNDKINYTSHSLPDNVEPGDYLVIRFYIYSNESNGANLEKFQSNMKYFLSGSVTLETEKDCESILIRNMDYGVVYNNRIVCVKGNDIRASALGDFSDFTEYVDEAGNPSATGAYATDVGSAGDFTGICAYNNVLLLFKKDIVAINFNAHSKKTEMYFFIMGENENENLNQGIAIISRYGKRKNCRAVPQAYHQGRYFCVHQLPSEFGTRCG